MEIIYDPTQVSYQQLLTAFLDHRDMTLDYPTQYATNIFYHSEAERMAAEAAVADVERELGGPIVISIRPAGLFTLAEDYHQKYNLKVYALMAAEFERMYPEDYTDSTAAARINGFLAGFGSQARIQEELGLYGLSPKAISLFLEETKHLPGTCSCF